MLSVSACAKCGACSAVCPVFRTSGRESHTARGKLHLLDVLGLAESSALFVDIFSACLLCGACSAVCPRQIDVCRELVTARNSFSALAGPHGYEKYLARRLLDYPGSLTGLRVLGHTGEKLLGARLPKRSGLRLRLALFGEDALAVPVREQILPPETDTTQLSWFPGCASRYLFPDILVSCRSLLADASFSLNFSDGLACCGLADWSAGDLEGARKSGRQNIEVLEVTGGPILVSCASCFAHLKKYPELFAENQEWYGRAEQVAARLVELTDFLDSQGKCETLGDDRSEKKLRIFYHDPCHMRHGSVTVDKAREKLQRTGRAELLELPDGPRCCGQGGLFHVAHPDISASIRDQLVKDVLALQPDVVTSTCSGCLMQWRQGLTAAGSEVSVLHLAQALERLRYC